MLLKHTPINTNQRKKTRLEVLLLKECKRGFLAYPKHFTYNVQLVRSPYISKAVHVPFYSNKVKDKQEMQTTRTYTLFEAKIFMEAKK